MGIYFGIPKATLNTNSTKSPSSPPAAAVIVNLPLIMSKKFTPAERLRLKFGYQPTAISPPSINFARLYILRLKSSNETLSERSESSRSALPVKIFVMSNSTCRSRVRGGMPSLPYIVS